MRLLPRNLSITFPWAWAHGSVTALEQQNIREEKGLLGAWNTKHMDGGKPKVLQLALAYSSFPCSWIPKLSRH